MELPADRVREALGEEFLTTATQAGALEPTTPQPSTTVRAPYSVQAIDLPNPTRTVWLFSDHGTLTSSQPLDGDFVLGVGGAGHTLLDITPRDRVQTALDLGTGCGIQALALARHAHTVIATDTSARALAFTRANATLNDVTNIVTRQGSLFDPTPEKFDLIVSNPPFVITPQGHTDTLEYRDAGFAGDGLMRALVTQLPAHLHETGQAVLLGNWEIRGDQRTDPTDWVDDSVDITVIVREDMNPVHYAETWIRDGGVPRASQRWATDTAAWLADFAARGVTGVELGWVGIRARGRRPSGAPSSALGAPASTAPVRHRATHTGPLGANPGGIAQFLSLRFDLLQWLATTTDEQLIATAFVKTEGLMEHRHYTPGDEDPTAITVEQGTGFAREFTVDPAFAACIGVADGTLSLGAVAQALAQLLDVDPTELTRQLVLQVREAVVSGIMYPAV